jgi:DNA-binding MarR family transcriptional regulator
MVRDLEIDELASALRVSVGLLVRRLRGMKANGDLSLPELSALARLDRDGPATGAELAKLEQISPQSMGATLATLESRSLIERSPDAADGRRVVFAPTDAGKVTLRNARNERVERLATALASAFDPVERDILFAAAPLLERLAQTI